MGSTRGHDGQLISIRYSKGRGRVPYVECWEDNVLALSTQPEWPAALLKQVRGYIASSKWFTESDAAALAQHLGCISKFQSVNSEDALTWSWFGTLACAEPAERRLVVQWLYDRIGLELTASLEPTIDQWMRVFHPNAPGCRNGPELDGRINDPAVALVYVEAKWNAGLGTGKGALENKPDDQIVLRRDSLRKDPALANDDRKAVVLVISSQTTDLGAYDEAQSDSRRAVTLARLSWLDLATCEFHPLASEFRRYLEWRNVATSSRGKR
jgi:hypothetical protein